MMCFSLGAVSIDLGLSYGSRSLADKKLSEAFEKGTVFCPELSLNFSWGLSLGALLETGYQVEGKVGTLNLYDSDMKVSNFEFFAGYSHAVGRFHPFARLGFGTHTFKMNIDADHLPVELTSFKENKRAVSLGGGVKVDLHKGFYLGGQVRYVFLKLRPESKLDVKFAELDLGGWRLMLTLGYRLSLGSR